MIGPMYTCLGTGARRAGDQGHAQRCPHVTRRRVFWDTLADSRRCVGSATRALLDGFGTTER
jgi:hypothetical protein